ncbi:hypothetical protein NUH30_06515 [Leptospira sp. 85282-16]|uniref:Porin n=1 Tax=Leptospira montravelensis TaxID=2484961 RepID=A0ABY2LPM9_9LEPT|nr:MULTISPECIES: hypothetical protein [Leptospira]MCT8333319.1 hypothetical protein [Leptospira sp. 85282-16]TGK79765.1 hypothetical protein EHQ19_08520 [Leptospira montravelensis]TGK99929.1 hypothetical protein EHQ31_13940 [Leptospira montravelensis]
MRYFLLIILSTFFCAYPLFADEASEKEKEIAAEEPPRTKYFSINPGVMIESVTVDISGRGRNATMTQEGPGKITWMLDLKSADYQITKYFGINLLLHNSNFYLDRQFVTKLPSVDSPSSTSSSGSSSGSGSSNSNPTQSNRVKDDLDTSMEGTYSMLVPIFYVGNPDTFRLGFGLGPATVRMRGNVDFQDPGTGIALALSNRGNRSEFLNNVSAIQFASGNINPSDDPTLSYLLANLGSGNNLELLGYYFASQGLLRPDLTAATAFSTGRYSAVESLALSSLFRNQVNINSNARFAFMFYIETPQFAGIRGRLSFGGPIVKENGYTYEMRTFHIAVYMPIEF